MHSDQKAAEFPLALQNTPKPLPYQMCLTCPLLSDQMSVAIDEVIEEFRSHPNCFPIQAISLATIPVIASEDPPTARHLIGAPASTLNFASYCGVPLDQEYVPLWRDAIRRHDRLKIGRAIGKCAIQKPGRLTPAERALLPFHVVEFPWSTRWIQQRFKLHPDASFFLGMAAGALHHAFGSGYPSEQKSTEVPSLNELKFDLRFPGDREFILRVYEQMKKISMETRKPSDILALLDGSIHTPEGLVNHSAVVTIFLTIGDMTDALHDRSYHSPDRSIEQIRQIHESMLKATKLPEFLIELAIEWYRHFGSEQEYLLTHLDRRWHQYDVDFLLDHKSTIHYDGSSCGLKNIITRYSQLIPAHSLVSRWLNDFIIPNA